MKKFTPLILLSFCFAVLLLQQAEAAIIYTDVTPDLETTTQTQHNLSYQFDVDGGGNDFGVGFTSDPDAKIGQAHTNIAFTSFSNMADAVSNVGSGTTIGPSSTWLNQGTGYTYWTYQNSNANWTLNTDGYFGIRIGTAGNYYYGWVRIQIQNSKMILKDYAFENTLNEPIDAGEMPPPPTTYTFAGTGNWDDATKWTPGYPGTNVTTGAAVIINGACTMNTSVTCAIPMTINASASLTVATPNTFNVSNSLTNNGGFTVNGNSNVNINSGGSFIHDGTSLSLSGKITNNASFTVNAGKTMTINSGGQFHEKGTGAINGALTNNGEVNVFATFSLTIGSGGSFTHAGDNGSISGTLLNNGDLTVNFPKILTVQSSGTFTHDGTSAIINGTLTNAGVVNVNAGKTLTINSPGSFTHNGSSATISGTLANNSSVTVSATRTLTINSSGNYIGNGGCNIYGSFLNEGSFSLNATKTVSVENGGTFTHNGTSTTVDGSFSVLGTFIINAGKTMTFSSTASYSGFGTLTISGTLISNGAFSINGSSITVSSGGTFTLGGTITSNLSSCSFVNNGDFTVSAGKTVYVGTNSSFTHNGTSANISGVFASPFPTSVVTINASKTLTIASGGSFTHTGNSLTVSGTLAVSSGGSFSQDSNNPVSISGAVTNEGTVTVNSSKTFSIGVGGTFTNTGLVTNNGTFNNNGMFTGTGTFNGNFNNTGGTVAPGASPGCMTFGGNFTNNGTINIEVDGTTACSGFDKMTINGTANLGGTLSVSITYTPALGDVVTFIDAGSVSGTFFNMNPALPSGWVVLYNNPNNGDVSLKYTQPPANDNCAGAISTTVSSTGACSYVSGTTVDATLSFDFACSFGGNEVYVDTWYSFTAPSSGKVTFHSGAGNPFAVIHSACSNSPVANGCMRGSGTVVGLSSGATYYLQLLTSGSSGAAFTFCLEESDVAPANNTCGTAIAIDLGNQLTVNSQYALTNTLPPCAPLPTLNAPDLWYSFTAPSGGAIGYAFNGGTILMTVYSGTCADLMEEVCAVPLGGNAPTNLTPGNTYYAQISSLGATASGTATISAPNNYTFTGATDSDWNNPSNWMSGAVPGSGNNITIPAGETCNLGVNFTPTGTITIASGGMLNIESGVVLNISGGTLVNNGTIGGGGSISGNYTNNGTLAPGSSPGCLTFSNDLTNNGTIEIEINGPTPCTQYDQVQVTGLATLGGTLNVTWGYTPSPGTFTLVTFGSRSGTFASVNIPPVAGLQFTESYTGTEFSITAALLPIELLSFEAKLLGEKAVLLSWQTASETNNEGFGIERSVDGKTWERIDFVAGHGTTHEEQAYAYTDERPLPGINYYRLRQMDFDDKFEYSRIVSVNVEEASNSIQIVPNPASEVVSVHFSGIQTDGELRILDQFGREVWSGKLEENQTSMTIHPVENRLSNGIYYVQVISSQGKKNSERLVIAR